MHDLATFFRALSDRQRLRIAEHLAGHDRTTVTELGAELRLSQPLISWHLRVLRRAGIVCTRREGRQVFCSLDRDALVAYERRMNEVFGLAVRPDAATADGVHDGEESEGYLKGAELCRKSG